MIPMNERRQILIVGAGAIGGLYAAYLAKLADVVVLDTNKEHVEAIKRGAYVKNVWLKGDDLAAFVEHEGEPDEDARGPSVRPHRSFREGTVVDGPTFPVSAGLRSNVSSAIATPVHCRPVDDP